jgi:hypothetical protein
MNKLTKLQELVKKLFKFSDNPIKIEEIASFPFPLPQQYQELLLIANGGWFKSDTLIIDESKYLSDSFDSFMDLGSTIEIRNGTINSIKDWELPFSIE